MRVYKLHREHLVALPLPEVFVFFAKPENLAKITPRALDFVILTPTPIEMKAGAEILYTIRVSGLRLRWTTIITQYDPPNYFVDEQRHGPYALWEHRHTFKAIDGGTLIIDDLRYALPLGWIGRFAHWLFVRNKVEEIFNFREKAIEGHFNSLKT